MTNNHEDETDSENSGSDANTPEIVSTDVSETADESVVAVATEEVVTVESDTEANDAPETETSEVESAAAPINAVDKAEEDTAEEDIVEHEKVDVPNLKQILEGAILASEKPLNIDHLMGLFTDDVQPTRSDIRAVIEEIQTDFADRGFELKQVASGYRFQVRHKYSAWVGRLWDERPAKYTRAFLETLALIAYKQPITRGDIEEIRGVTVSTNIMRSLLEREWIRVVGHRDVPGRPAIYATTREFLDYFDLSNLDELPSLAEIKDLGDANEKLDLATEELITPRTLELEAAESTEDGEENEEEDASLDEVTKQVNQIQENIKNLFAEPEPDDGLDDELDGVQLDLKPEQAESEQAEPEEPRIVKAVQRTSTPNVEVSDDSDQPPADIEDSPQQDS